VRPEALLFLHILGAISLFGAVTATAILGVAGARGPGRGTNLARASLMATIAVSVPAWALTVVFGSWTKSREGIPGSTEWLRIGNGIATAGVLVLLAVAAFSYAWTRRPADPRLAGAVALVSLAYLAALGVAWWVMTAKVPS
jgi:hypothetical protein